MVECGLGFSFADANAVSMWNRVLPEINKTLGRQLSVFPRFTQV